VHYKGHPDPLRGDALNKAVREMANEAMAAIFSTEESKPGPIVSEGLGKRIQGFGNYTCILNLCFLISTIFTKIRIRNSDLF
jgi:hypothetical protein